MESEKIKSNRKFGKGLARFCYKAFIVLVIIMLVGIAYEKVGEYQDTKGYPPVGRLVEVNKHRMHIYGKGEGKVTVVFASGLGTPCPYTDFFNLTEEISKGARAVVYDRPGYGWSDTVDGKRNIDIVAKEIHAALTEAGERAPYIFVAHSIASLEAIRFAQLYKNEVKGIIFIDGGNPEFYAQQKAESSAFKDIMVSTLKESGIGRVMFMNHDRYLNFMGIRNKLRLMPKNLLELDISMSLRHMGNEDVTEEDKESTANAKKVMANGKLGSLPMTILTASESSKDALWEKSQEDFKNWSSKSRQLVVKGSDHYIHQYQPKEVCREIMGLVEKVQ